jgi:hypothetical protein
MKIMQEITVWKDIVRQPNHVYLMDGDKIVAYSKWGKEPAETLRTPLRINRRGRKFVEVKDNPWKFKITVEKPTGRTWEVAGSKGGTYTVTEDAGTWSCTCSGFTFRGRCRHVTEIQTTV